MLALATSLALGSVPTSKGFDVRSVLHPASDAVADVASTSTVVLRAAPPQSTNQSGSPGEWKGRGKDAPGQWQNKSAFAGPGAYQDQDHKQGQWHGEGENKAQWHEEEPCPGHPNIRRSSEACETKTVNNTWVVGGEHAPWNKVDHEPRGGMWISRASKKNVPPCATFLKHPCGIENCETANGHGACVKPNHGTCASACQSLYGKQGNYIQGLEPFVDAQCRFTYNTSFPEWLDDKDTGTFPHGRPSNIAQCACFTGNRIGEEITGKVAKLNGTTAREYVAVCEDPGYVAAPGREHAFSKADAKVPCGKSAMCHEGDQTHNEDHPEDNTVGICFPSASTVMLADGRTRVRMEALRHGDAVRAVTRDGRLTNDTVSFLSLSDADAIATFVRLATVGGAAITLTPEHRLPVGDECCGTLKQAKDVEQGDSIWVAAGGRTPAPQHVDSTTRVVARGQHSPVLTKGSFPLVEEPCGEDDASCRDAPRDGVVTAFDSIGWVDFAAVTVPVFEPLCEATGTCSLLRWALLRSGRRYVDLR